jgi:hypothetical protein
MWFKITWPTGLTTHESSETQNREAYAMERWGQDSLEAVEALGVKIEHAVHEELVSLGIISEPPSAEPVASGDSSTGETAVQEPMPEPAATAETAPPSETAATSDTGFADTQPAAA